MDERNGVAWTYEEVVFVLYKYIDNNYSMKEPDYKGVPEILGRSWNSVSLRLGNYKSLMDDVPGKGLTGISEDCRRAVTEYNKNKTLFLEYARKIEEFHRGGWTTWKKQIPEGWSKKSEGPRVSFFDSYRKMGLEERAEIYKRFLKKISFPDLSRRNGAGDDFYLSESSLGTYAPRNNETALSKWINRYDTNNRGMYGNLNAGEFESVVKKLYHDNDPDNGWKKGNNAYSNAVTKYLEFLRAIEFADEVMANLKGPDEEKNSKSDIQNNRSIILYGPPGTGKSKHLKYQIGTDSVLRTTFHPDSDYASFVGAYKPTEEGGKLTYKFVPQVFIKAYCEAWKKYAADSVTPKNQYLVIEELNRGNCAQIFGDLFQLLDRDDNGFSEYPIEADEDIGKYIAGVFAEAPKVADLKCPKSDEIKEGKLLVLPPNLLLRATMNTSDQSLFPMDSAFKRRWDWKYVPIKDGGKGYQIDLEDGRKCGWWDFLQKINREIKEVCGSEDKQLGYFFVKLPDGKNEISADVLVNKVFFYLWNDVFRIYGFDKEIFQKKKTAKDGEKETDPIAFRDFFKDDGAVKTEAVAQFLENLGLSLEGNAGEEAKPSESGQKGGTAEEASQDSAKEGDESAESKDGE